MEASQKQKSLKKVAENDEKLSKPPLKLAKVTEKDEK